MPPRPERRRPRPTSSRGLYRFAARPRGPATIRPRSCSPGPAQRAARDARDELAEHYDVGAELWSATSYKAAARGGARVERWNRLHPAEPAADPVASPSCCADAAGPIVAVTDFMKAVPDQIARWVPGDGSLSLGTDGFGRSDTREALRRYFEIDAAARGRGRARPLAAEGAVGKDTVEDAIRQFGVATDRPDPWSTSAPGGTAPAVRRRQRSTGTAAPSPGTPTPTSCSRTDPLALLIGMLLDQQVPDGVGVRRAVPAEAAARRTARRRRRSRRWIPTRSSALFRRKPALHRYPGVDGASAPSALCRHLVEHYDGDAADGVDGRPIGRRSCSTGCGPCPASATRRPASSWPSSPSASAIRPEGWEEAAGAVLRRAAALGRRHRLARGPERGAGLQAGPEDAGPRQAGSGRLRRRLTGGSACRQRVGVPSARSSHRTRTTTSHWCPGASSVRAVTKSGQPVEAWRS